MSPIYLTSSNPNIFWHCLYNRNVNNKAVLLAQLFSTTEPLIILLYIVFIYIYTHKRHLYYLKNIDHPLEYSISRQSLMPGGMFSMFLHLHFLTCWPKPHIRYSCLRQKKSFLGTVSAATHHMSHGLLLSINCAAVFNEVGSEPSFVHKKQQQRNNILAI